MEFGDDLIEIAGKKGGPSTRPCPKCGTLHDRNGSYCFKCHAAYMRDWRKTHPLNEGARRRDISRSYANVYKQRGKISPQPCRICGSKAEMHHLDHEKPLEVTWLCREHHLAWHSFWREAVFEVFATWQGLARETFSPASAPPLHDLIEMAAEKAGVA